MPFLFFFASVVLRIPWHLKQSICRNPKPRPQQNFLLSVVCRRRSLPHTTQKDCEKRKCNLVRVSTRPHPKEKGGDVSGPLNYIAETPEVKTTRTHKSPHACATLPTRPYLSVSLCPSLPIACDSVQARQETERDGKKESSEGITEAEIAQCG